MSRYYWPLTRAQDRKVRARFAERIAERHDRNWQTLEDDEWPLLSQPNGRAALQFYRSQSVDWWGNIAATYPDHARWHLRQYASLIRRYGSPMQVAA